MENQRSKQLKNILLYATIGVLVAISIIAIFMIFFGNVDIMLNMLCTIGIIYLMTLLSMHNLSRMNSPQVITRSCAISALVFNLFWGIPWILIVWGVFDYSTADIVWRFVWTALIFSGYCTLLSTQLPQPKEWKGLVRVQQSIPLVLVSYVCLNALVFVWSATATSSFSLVCKFICSELILIALQWAIPEILLRNQAKQQNHPQQIQNNAQPMNTMQNQNNHPAQDGFHVVSTTHATPSTQDTTPAKSHEEPTTKKSKDTSDKTTSN